MSYTPTLGDFVTGKIVDEIHPAQGWIVRIHPTVIIRGASGTEYNIEGNLILVDNPPVRPEGMQYIVSITRSESVTRNFVVTANDHEEAKRLAMEEATDLVWKRAGDAEYVTDEPEPIRL